MERFTNGENYIIVYVIFNSHMNLGNIYSKLDYDFKQC